MIILHTATAAAAITILYLNGNKNVLLECVCEKRGKHSCMDND